MLDNWRLLANNLQFWLILTNLKCLFADQIVPDLQILILITSFCLWVYNDELMSSSSLWNDTWIIRGDTVFKKSHNFSQSPVISNHSFFQLLLRTVFFIVILNTWEQLEKSRYLVSLELDKDDAIQKYQCYKGYHSCKYLVIIKLTNN